MTAVDIVMQHGMERLLLQGWGGDLLAYGLSHNMGADWKRRLLQGQNDNQRGRGRLLETGRLLDEGGAKSNHNGNRKERILNGQ